MTDRIHIFGASGSGTTTLGQALAARLGGRHLDTDAYYWVPTDPPFTHKRDPSERVAMIQHDTADVARWVLSGSLCSWGDPLLASFTLAIFVRLEPQARLRRLRNRETQRHGARIQPGGDMHDQHVAFMEWASRYDTADASIRSLEMHRQWMTRLDCPVIELDSIAPVDTLCDHVVACEVAGT